MQLRCRCGFRHTSVTVFSRHIRRHYIESNQACECPFRCGRSFGKYKKWRLHLSHHLLSPPGASAAVTASFDDSPVIEVESPQDGSNAPVEDNSAGPSSAHELGCEPACESTTYKQARSDVADLLLTLRDDHHSTQAACSYVAVKAAALLKNGVKEYCKRAGVKFDENVLKKTPTFTALKGLNTGHKLQKFCTDELGVVEPETHHLGKSEHGCNQSFQYVPIIKQLKWILVRGLIDLDVPRSETNTSERLYTDYSDGSLHKDISNKHIKVILYYDDLGVVNPLGNRARDLKLGAVYFSLGNVPPKDRSRVDQIYLTLLFRARYVKQYSLKRLFQPLIDDLKTLETSGFDVDLNGVTTNVKGFVCFIAADNLAAHLLAGYKCSFSRSAKVCRFCDATPEDVKSVFSLSSLTIQTRDDYDAKLALLKEENFPAETCKRYGIVSESPISELSRPHVVDAFPPDIAHDLFEGVVPTVLQAVLNELIFNGEYFTIDFLNRQVLTFEFPTSDKRHKPVPIHAEGRHTKVRLTQSQTWTFLRFLPILVGDRVPEHNAIWQLMLSLINIVNLVCAPVISSGTLHYLQYCVELYLPEVARLLGKDTLTPKAHYLLHYVQQTRRHGPLKFAWTLRFESKHQELKKYSQETKNRRDICKHIAKRHQNVAGRRDSKKEEADFACGDFAPGDILVARKGQGSAAFWIVVGYVDGCLECRQLQCVYFDRHLNAYRVKECDTLVCLDSCDLMDSTSLGLVCVSSLRDGKRSGLVVLQHHIEHLDEEVIG